MTSSTSLLDFAETVRVRTLGSLAPASRARLGQFFTNSLTASMMAAMPRLPRQGTLRVLDPGAGSGALSAALIARLLEEAPNLAIDLTAIELDSAVVPALEATLRECQSAVQERGGRLAFRVVSGSYVEQAEALGASFDIAILNPPYAKLPAGDPDRVAVAERLVDPANIYAAFVALAMANLKAGGQLVAITPRSFTNGLYFEPYRRWLLDQAAFDQIHIYGSRGSVFADTGVLQENIVYAMTRGARGKKVLITASLDHENDSTQRLVAYDEIVHPSDAHQYIRIPATAADADVVDLMGSLPCTLADLGVQASTGRVVDFRSREQLVEPARAENYPMVYSANISHSELAHPRSGIKVQRYSITAPEDRRWLVPSGIYVLVKRFSAKEERRRLVAGVWDNAVHEDAPVAIDNKLNYIHSQGKGLDRPLAMGLAIWLNSTPVDNYFRTFSGHTQVNATDLRGMRFPSADFLRSLGTGLSVLPAPERIDALAAAAFLAQEAAA